MSMNRMFIISIVIEEGTEPFCCLSSVLFMEHCWWYSVSDHHRFFPLTPVSCLQNSDHSPSFVFIPYVGLLDFYLLFHWTSSHMLAYVCLQDPYWIPSLPSVSSIPSLFWMLSISFWTAILSPYCAFSRLSAVAMLSRFYGNFIDLCIVQNVVGQHWSILTRVLLNRVWSQVSVTVCRVRLQGSVLVCPVRCLTQQGHVRE